MKKVFCLALCLLLPGFASAEMYKWVDADGKVHYSDTDPALDNKKPATTEIIEPDETNVFSSEEAKIIPKEKPPEAPPAATQKDGEPPPDVY